MTVVHTVQGGRVLIALNGDLDLKTSGPLRDALDRLIDRMREKDWVLDLAEVDFMDSSGLGVILGRFRRLKATGRSLSIVGARPAVRAVLDLAGVSAIMPVSDYLPKSSARQG